MNVIEALKSETQQIYNQLDSFTEEWIENYIASGGKVFCHKGCNNCCDLPVGMTLAEALLISDNFNNDVVNEDKLRTYLDKLIGSSGFMGISTANSNQNPLGATVTALPCRQ